MTHDEIIAMAQEAGLGTLLPAEMAGSTLLPATWVGADQRKLERFAALVAAKEREAWRASLEPAFRGRMGSEQVREIVQSAIRARGQKEGA